MAKILYEITLCVDCTLHHNNGECGNCAWCAPVDCGHNYCQASDIEGCFEVTPEPLPLSALTPEERGGLALGAHEHQDNCTEEDRQEGCDCGRAECWTFWCGGCGRYTSGDAHDAVIFDR